MCRVLAAEVVRRRWDALIVVLSVKCMIVSWWGDGSPRRRDAAYMR